VEQHLEGGEKGCEGGNGQHSAHRVIKVKFVLKSN
jgi:hypothetical protein